LNRKSIAPARQRLHVPGIAGGFAQSLPQTENGGVDAVADFDDRAVWPELSADILAEYHFAGPLQQHGQNPERLFLEFHLGAVPPEFGGANIELEIVETNDADPSE
jgi:hypothetical protein